MIGHPRTQWNVTIYLHGGRIKEMGLVLQINVKPAFREKKSVISLA